MMKEAVQNASAPAMKIVAHIYNDFPAKFGIPRQSGLVNTLPSKLVLEPDYRNVDAFRGIEGFSHLWLLWMFSESIRDNWTPTVHPPRLGGNQRMGVFATRSPFRPNPIGLSSVRLALYCKPYIKRGKCHSINTVGIRLISRPWILLQQVNQPFPQRNRNHLQPLLWKNNL